MDYMSTSAAKYAYNDSGAPELVLRMDSFPVALKWSSWGRNTPDRHSVEACSDSESHVDHRGERGVHLAHNLGGGCQI